MTRVISDALLQNEIGWHPHKNQQEILKANKRNTCICAGTRWGKSALCGYVALKYLLADNQRIWIVSLTYDMAQKVFSYVYEFAGALDKRLLKGVSKRPVPRFEIIENNSWVECKSADTPASLMGEELDLVIVDEAAQMHPEVWSRYLRARLASRQGKSFIISTPFGKTWFYEWYLKCKNDPQGASFNFKSVDNPYFPPEEYERLKKDLPEAIFRQEYEANFLDDAAAVFRNVNSCCSGALKGFQSGHQYVMGVDLGRRGDFTVLIVIDRMNHQVVAFDRFNQIDWELQKKRIMEMADKYNKPIIQIDATTISVGDAYVEDLSRAGYRIEGYKIDSNAKKKQLIEKLSVFIDQRRIAIPPECDILLDELGAYSYKLTESGIVQYQAPSGLHDDCVMSLALAVWNLFDKPLLAKTHKERKRIKGIGI